jgi:hypothetical protein
MDDHGGDVSAADRGGGDLTAEKLQTELRLLAEMDIRSTAEFAVRAANPTYSSERFRTVDINTKADHGIAAAAGGVIGGQESLIDAANAEATISELRDTLSDRARSADDAEELLTLWIRTEPLLTEEETRELMPSVIARVFGGTGTSIRSSRGAAAQGGGE